MLVIGDVKCLLGRNVRELVLWSYVNKVQYVKKKIERGVAFPTCLSVNNTVCHYSPLASDETVLKEGDILKM